MCGHVLEGAACMCRDEQRTTWEVEAVLDTLQWLKQKPPAQPGEFLAKQRALKRFIFYADKRAKDRTKLEKATQLGLGLDDQLLGCAERHEHFQRYFMLAEDTLDWLDKNLLAEKHEYEAKQKELEDCFKQDLAAAYARIDRLQVTTEVGGGDVVIYSKGKTANLEDLEEASSSDSSSSS